MFGYPAVNLAPEDAVSRARDTKHWLEKSGPRFVRAVVGFCSYNHPANQMRVIWDGVECWLRPSDMSYASWYLLSEVETGDAVDILIRCDPLRKLP